MPKRRIKRICSPCLSLETKMSNQPGQCAGGRRSGSTTHRPGLMPWMSKCVDSPLAEFGKQTVNGKQKRAFSAELCTTGNARLETSAGNIAVQMYAPEKHGGGGQFPLWDSLRARNLTVLPTPVLRAPGCPSSGKAAPGEHLPTLSPILPPSQVGPGALACLWLHALRRCRNVFLF